MRIRNLLAGAITLAAVSFGSLSAIRAQSLVRIAEVESVGGYVEYTITNDSHLYPPSPQFDITAFVISPPAGAAAINARKQEGGPVWYAQDIDAISWELPMGGDPVLATWHQYTGMAYEAWFPPSPVYPPSPVIPSMGYFLNYTLSGGTVTFPPGPMHPGETFSGFLREGFAAESIFLAAGPTDASQAFPLGEVENFVGTTTVVPEPSSFAMLLVGAGVLSFRYARTRKRTV